MEFRVYADNDPLPRLLIAVEDPAKINSRLIAVALQSHAAKERWRLHAIKPINRGYEESVVSRVLQVDRLNDVLDLHAYISEQVGAMLEALE